jgi:hypothetical protein
MLKTNDPVTQIIGFPPSDFLDEVAVAVDEKLIIGLTKFKQELTKIASNKNINDSKSTKLDKGCEKLLNQMKIQFDKNMDKFDIYASRNIFVLPMDDDINQKSSSSSSNQSNTSKDELENISNEITILRNKYLGLRSLHNDLTIENESCELLLQDMKQALFSLKVGAQILEDQNVQPLSKNIAELTKKQIKLQELCAKAAEFTSYMNQNNSINNDIINDTNITTTVVDNTTDVTMIDDMIKTSGIEDIKKLTNSIHKK